MANDRQELAELEELERLEAKAASAAAHQKAGPQPFQPADNQSKVKAAQTSAESVMASLPPGIRAQAHSPDETTPEGGHIGMALPEFLGAEAAGAAARPLVQGIGYLLQGASKVGKAATSPLDTLNKVGVYLKGVGRVAPEALESAGASGLPVKGTTVAPESLSSGLERGSSIDPSRIKLDPYTGAINPNKPKWDFPIRKRGLGVE